MTRSSISSATFQPDLDAHLNTPSPRFSTEEAERVALKEYGLVVSASELSGERDRTFLLNDARGERLVLKICNAGDTKPVREFQSGVLRHIEASDPTLPVPRLLATLAGHDEFSVLGMEGQGFFGSLVSFLPGDPAASRPSTRQRRINFGRTLAQLDNALAGYAHPSDRRLLCWDLMHAARLLDIVDVIEDTELGRSVANFLRRFDAEVRPQVELLRTQIIHNDANNSNLLLNPGDADVVSGIIDFGDMVRAPLVNEVAVCASYELHGDADPIGCILDVIKGFSQRTPLLDSEIMHVFDLVLARLSVRLLITNWRAQRYPENRQYLLRNTLPARRAFELLTCYSNSEGRERILRQIAEPSR